MFQKKSGRPTTSPDAAPVLAAYRARMSDPPVERIHTKTEWQQRRTVVREKLQQTLGLQPMPDRLALETRSGGVLEGAGYRLERLYWQTWPGIFAGGWLSLPTQPVEGASAVLLVHGSAAPAPDEAHPKLARLALLGYIVLAVDPLSATDYRVGLTSGAIMTVAHLRALDLLAARPEVDRQRLGLVALPSAAESAVHLLALDDRLRAAVVCLRSLALPRLAESNPEGASPVTAPGLLQFTSGAELCAVASPRALLFVTPEGEDSRTFQDRDLRELRSYYHLWQQPDRLAHLGAGTGDLSTPPAREAVYIWLDRELRGSRNLDPIREPEPILPNPESLTALDPPPIGYADTAAIARWYDKRVVAQPPQLEGKPARRSYQERVTADVRTLLGLPAHACSLESKGPSVVSYQPSAISNQRPATSTRTPEHLNTPRTPEHPNTSHRHTPTQPHSVNFRSEPDVRLLALWSPGTGTQPYPVLIAVHPEGKEAAFKSELVRGFQAAGHGVLAPDVRLRGELQAEWGADPLQWGRPEAGMAVTDIHACVQWLLGEEGVDARSIVLWGDGELGVAAMLAAGLEERITATVADCRSTTYRDGGEGLPLIPNILRVADVPQIASLVAPRPLWLYQVPEERVGFSSRRYYDWTRRSFQSLGEVEALKMSTKSLPDSPALLDWLKLRLKRARR